MKKLILAIETSCDETGLALVEASDGITNPRFKVIKNLISSQIKIHRPFGGVVPNLAKREHIRNLPVLFEKLKASFSNSKFKNQNAKLQFKIKKMVNSVDSVVVTIGPGLEPALWTGINFAEEIRKKYFPKAKLIGANHLEGHLYSFLLYPQKKTQISKFKSLNPERLEFPAISLLVSGGHTILLKMDSLTKWKKLGETRDDAAGEAFDKVARMLNLPYPGGPEIERLSARGNAEAIAFPRPMIHTKDYEFSFSGLKTSVFYYLKNSADSRRLHAEQRGKGQRKSALSPRKSADVADIAASFQEAIVDVLVSKTMKAAREFGARSVILCGGVAANKLLRSRLRHATEKMGAHFFAPSPEYNTDNAAMIAATGYLAYLKKKKLPLTADGDLGI